MLRTSTTLPPKPDNIIAAAMAESKPRMEQNGGSRGAECGVIWVLTRIELRKLRQSPRKVFSRRTALFSVSISEVSSSEASVAAPAALLFFYPHIPRIPFHGWRRSSPYGALTLTSLPRLFNGFVHKNIR